MQHDAPCHGRGSRTDGLCDGHCGVDTGCWVNVPIATTEQPVVFEWTLQFANAAGMTPHKLSQIFTWIFETHICSLMKPQAE